MPYRRFLIDFGAAVRERRLARRMTQPQVADLVEGLDQGGLSRLERGLQGFDSDTLYQLARALDLPAYRLFGGLAPDAAKVDLPPEAVDVARQWLALTPAGRMRFRAAMILAMEPIRYDMQVQERETKKLRKRA